MVKAEIETFDSLEIGPQTQGRKNEMVNSSIWIEQRKGLPERERWEAKHDGFQVENKIRGARISKKVEAMG